MICYFRLSLFSLLIAYMLAYNSSGRMHRMISGNCNLIICRCHRLIVKFTSTVDSQQFSSCAWAAISDWAHLFQCLLLKNMLASNSSGRMHHIISGNCNLIICRCRQLIRWIYKWKVKSNGSKVSCQNSNCIKSWI